MKKNIFFLSVGFVMMSASGCATTNSSSLLAFENRLQTLEAKVEALDSRKNSTYCSVDNPLFSDFLLVEEAQAAVIDASKMTKQQVQLALKKIGYYDGKIDGKLGARSKAAIKKFQKDMGLKVDGIAGQKTKEKLVKYL